VFSFTLHRQSVALLVTVCVLSLPLTAFSSSDQQSPGPAVGREPLPTIDVESLSRDYAAERAHLPLSRHQRIIGLVLSGGGTKAAMFSHGVLHGLHDAQVLERVDAISSVSGGGYAAFWYLSKYLESTRSPIFRVSQIFDDCVPSYWTKYDTGKSLQAAMKAAIDRPPKPGMPECDNAAHFRAKGTSGTDDPYRWQAHVMRWPDVLQVAPVHLDGGIQGSPERTVITGLVLAATLEFAKNLVGGESAVPRLYQYGIERTWGLNPLPRDASLAASNSETDERKIWRYTNLGRSDEDMGSKFSPRVNPETMQWLQLSSLYGSAWTSASPPLWIVNATDGDKRVSKATGASDTTKIFEITPFGYGSANPDHSGYLNRTPEPPLPISDLGTSMRASAAFADAQGLENRYARGMVGAFAKFFPGAKWSVDVDAPGSKGYKLVSLSDGGGSENLGLYSLLKRGLDDIIVVDTASDPEGNMADICNVRNALKSEGVEMRFEVLENLEIVCDPQRAKPDKLSYNVSAWKNPVIKGTVLWKSKNGQPARTSHIWLIKAAWDERAVAAAYTRPKTCGNETGKINCLLTVFYAHNTSVRSKSDNYMLFPQLGTVATTANSSSYLFWGYRELGRMLASHLRVSDTGRLELRNDIQCKQAAHRWRKGGRPENIKYIAPSPCD